MINVDSLVEHGVNDSGKKTHMSRDVSIFQKNNEEGDEMPNKPHTHQGENSQRNVIDPCREMLQEKKRRGIHCKEFEFFSP